MIERQGALVEIGRDDFGHGVGTKWQVVEVKNGAGGWRGPSSKETDKPRSLGMGDKAGNIPCVSCGWSWPFGCLPLSEC